MLRFNIVRFDFCVIYTIISIHLMLRFNFFALLNSRRKPYFNTSYVTVQLLWVDLFLIYQNISIHLMLRFNLDTKAPTESMPNFNTSYVTVQLVPKLVPICPLYNFNTSYVTVQPFIDFGLEEVKIISIHLMLRFNKFKL